jgi:uncharacterized OsmC-like protein
MYQVGSQVSACEICGGRSGIGTGFSPAELLLSAIASLIAIRHGRRLIKAADSIVKQYVGFSRYI